MTKPLINSHIYEAGRDAQRLGKPRASCPYTKGAKAASHQRREWLKGYDDQRHGGPQEHPVQAEQGRDRKWLGLLANTNLLEEMVVNALPSDEIPDTLPTEGTPPKA